MIRFEWKKLGVNLDIALSRLNQMTKTKYPHEMDLEMMQAWWQETTPHARWGEIHYGFAGVHRHNLVKQTQNFRIMADDMKRGDITHYILRQFEKPKHGKTVCDCNDCE